MCPPCWDSPRGRGCSRSPVSTWAHAARATRPRLEPKASSQVLDIRPSLHAGSLGKNRTLENQAALVDADFFWALPDYMRQEFPRGSEALRQVEVAVKEFYFGKQGTAKYSMQQFVDVSLLSSSINP